MWARSQVALHFLNFFFFLSNGSLLSKTDLHDNGISNCQNIKSVAVSELGLGRNVHVDENSEIDLLFPCWFDITLARSGQRFARRYFPQLINSHFLSLFLLVMHPEIRRVLYYTRKSNTPDRAFRRYIATVLQVKLWYDTDILQSNWSASIRKVRNLHSGISYVIRKEFPDISRPLVTRDNRQSGFQPNEDFWRAIKLDIEHSGLNRTLPNVNTTLQPKFFFNQYAMAITQWSFMAMPILFSNEIHLVWPTEEELAGFAHLWAGISYKLGMNESYILCKDRDLKTCEKTLKIILKEHFLPYLYHIDYETQIMLESLCHVVSGVIPQVTSELFIIQLLEDIVGIPCPNLRAYSGWYTQMLRMIQRIAEPFYHWPGMQWIGNVFLRGQVQLSSLRVFGFDGTNPSIVAQRGFH